MLLGGEGKRAKKGLKWQKNSVWLCILRTVLQIIVAIGTHVKNKWYLHQVFLFVCFADFFSFFKILIFQVFLSSSINAKRNFWCVPHLLHMFVIFIISASIYWKQLLLVLFFNDVSVLIIYWVVMLMVLLQNFTISSIQGKENCFSFEYQLSRNSWLWFTIVGSNMSSNSLGIIFSLMHCNKKSLWDSNRVFLSCNRFSLITK